MTIYILDNDPKKIAEYLADKSLDRMIRSVQRQSSDLVEDIRRVREKRMLREALGGDGD